jgi:hypothetical protein
MPPIKKIKKDISLVPEKLTSTASIALARSLYTVQLLTLQGGGDGSQGQNKSQFSCFR